MTTVVPSLCSTYCSLTIDHTKVSENATYAVLFSGSGDSAVLGTRLPDDLFANCQSDGGDICFATDSTGATQLACEVVTIDTANKRAEIWVPVSLTTSADVVICVFYKSNGGTLAQPAASGSFGAQAVWTSVGNLKGVWHFGTSGSLGTSESTSAGITLTNHSAVATTGGLGSAGGGMSTNNAAGYMTGVMTTSGAITEEFMYKRAAGDSNNEGLIAGNTPGNNYQMAYIGGSGAPGQFAIAGSGGGTGVVNCPNDTNWHFAAAVSNGASGTLRIDGTTTTNAATITMAALTLGRYGDNSTGTFHGFLDELRIHTVARSNNYLGTDRNIWTSTALVTVGTPTSTGRVATMSQTLNDVTISGASLVSVSPVMSQTLVNESVAGVSLVTVAPNFSQTLVNESLAGSFQIVVGAAQSQAMSNDQIAGASLIGISSNFSQVLSPLQLSSSVFALVEGSASLQLSDVVDSSGALAIAGASLTQLLSVQGAGVTSAIIASTVTKSLDLAKCQATVVVSDNVNLSAVIAEALSVTGSVVSESINASFVSTLSGVFLFASIGKRVFGPFRVRFSQVVGSGSLETEIQVPRAVHSQLNAAGTSQGD